MTVQKINPRFRILSALAIIFVVAGHADFGVFDVAGLFPYYSFHVGVFAFVSGYFYNDSSEQNLSKYFVKKAKHLLLPYFAWNLFYGLFTTFLRSFGFGIGSSISFKSLFIDPFLGGHQYGFNFAAWFVPVLFLVEVLNVLMRKILDILHLKKEYFIFAVSLLIGMVVVWLSIGGSVWGYRRHIGCILFLFPIFQAGKFYKSVLEKHIEKLTLPIYFSIVLFIQYAILLTTHGQIAYSTVWCSGFLHTPWIPYLTTFTGIAFWLGIARVLEPIWKPGNLLDTIGKNTFSIMMHHVTGFFVLNTVFFAIGFQNFDVIMYKASYEYRYLPLGMENGKWLYLIFGIGFSLLVNVIVQKIKAKLVLVKKCNNP